jgi:DNA-binding NtrC family response regulator
LASPLFAVPARPDASDERVASRSATRLLITAPTSDLVEVIARRIHGAGRGAAPFVQVAARDLPGGTFLLTAAFASLFNRATTGGSLLFTDVEEMPEVVQDELLGVIEGLQSARVASTPSASSRARPCLCWTA